MPVTMAAGATASADAIWVPNRAAGTVVRLDPKTNTAGAPLSVGPSPCASLSAGFDSIWVPLCGSSPGIARVDAAKATVTATVPLTVAGAEGSTAVAVGSLWVLASQKGVLTRVDPDSSAPVAETYVAEGAEAVVAGEDALWVTSGKSGMLTRVNPHNNEVVEAITVGSNPGRMAVGEGGVWILNRGDGGSGPGATVSRVDPKTNKVVATITVGDLDPAAEIAAGEGSVWISAPGRADHSHRSTDESGRAAVHRRGWRRDPRGARLAVGRGRGTEDAPARSGPGGGDKAVMATRRLTAQRVPTIHGGGV